MCCAYASRTVVGTWSSGSFDQLYGAKLNPRGIADALHWTPRGGDDALPVLQLLLSIPDINVNARNMYSYQTALLVACEWGAANCVRALEAGADMDIHARCFRSDATGPAWKQRDTRNSPGLESPSYFKAPASEYGYHFVLYTYMYVHSYYRKLQ